MISCGFSFALRFKQPLLHFHRGAVAQRHFSSIVDGVEMHPNNVEVPIDKISFFVSRSSGPGGQNVNKVNSKAELRFHIGSADWIHIAVRRRIREQHANKINNEDELILVSQEQRVQSRNKEICLDKLRIIIAGACVEPKEREQYEGLSDTGKERRKTDKRKRGDVKSSRGNSRASFHD
jgi:peptidyl-tRNA hydrolase ICT1